MASAAKMSERVSKTDVERRFELIYTTIRERICLLEYAPGERLSEAVLAREFDVSRTPVRSVLSKLEFEGLVIARHGAGNFVTDIELEELCEVYRFRMELVPLIGQLSPNEVTEDLLERARGLGRKILEIKENVQVDKHTKTEFARINMAFFELIMELVGNRPLRETLERLFYLSARMWPYLMNESTVLRETKIFSQEISNLVRLLEAGGIDSIGYLRRSHIEMALQRLIEMSPEGCRK